MNEDQQAFLNDTFLRSGVDWVRIRTDQDYVKPLNKPLQKAGSQKIIEMHFGKTVIASEFKMYKRIIHFIGIT